MINEGLECVMLDPMGLLLLPPAAEPKLRGDDEIMIPQKLMRRMMLSGVWQRYERGQIPSLEDAATELAELPFMTSWWRGGLGAELAQTIARCILHSLSHLREVPAMSKLLHTLREQLHVTLVCASNATSKEIRMLQSRLPSLFGKFNTIVISGEEGVGKSSQRFMHAALQKAGVRHAHHTMYLDAHDIQSIIAARSIGMHAILVQPDSASTLEHVFISDNMGLKDLSSKVQQYNHIKGVHSTCSQNTCTPPILMSTTVIDKYANHDSTLASAQKFLLQTGHQEYRSKAHQFLSLTSDGIRITDTFAQFLIADVLNDARFLPMQSPPANGLLCFADRTSFSVALAPDQGNCLAVSSLPTTDASTLQDIPEDLDITSIGLSVLHNFGNVSMETINKVLDKMMEYVSRDDGVLQVYFDPERPRIDPVVVANVVYLFHLANRGQEVEASERFVQSVLLHRAYEDGTLYYSLGEAFLLHVARLVRRFKEHFTRSGMNSLLAARLREHRSSMRWADNGGNALALAMSMRAYFLCGLEEDADPLVVTRETERQQLVRLQRANGCWDCDAYYRYGGNLQSWIGNEGLTTAYALIALNPALQL